jgi:hypothetical protein
MASKFFPELHCSSTDSRCPIQRYCISPYIYIFMYIFIYLYIKIGIIFKEERLNYCVKKIRKFESSGVQYRKYTTIKME